MRHGSLAYGCSCHPLMARSVRGMLSRSMARSRHLSLSAHGARSACLLLSINWARSPALTLFLAMARSFSMVLSVWMARFPDLVQSPLLARSKLHQPCQYAPPALRIKLVVRACADQGHGSLWFRGAV